MGDHTLRNIVAVLAFLGLLATIILVADAA